MIQETPANGMPTSPSKDANDILIEQAGKHVKFVREISPEEKQEQEGQEVVKKWRAQDPGRYFIAFGAMLACCAGFVNVTASMTCGSFVGHVTGTSTRLGMAIEGYYSDEVPSDRVFQTGLLVLSFHLGAVLCGLLVSRNEVHFGKSAYGVALMMNSLLLLGAIAVSDAEIAGPVYFDNKWIALYMMSAACGLQNGMCTAHFGAVVRTTHLTGLMTDSGLTIGRMISIMIRTRCSRKRFGPLDRAEIAVDLKKLVVFACLLTGFISGVLLGAQMADILGINALIIPATVTGGGGLIYSFAKANCWYYFERAEEDMLAHDLEEAEEIFDRSRKLIESMKAGEILGPDTGALEDLDGEVHKALDKLHDMEHILYERITRTETELSSPAADRRRSKHLSDITREASLKSKTSSGSLGSASNTGADLARYHSSPSIMTAASGAKNKPMSPTYALRKCTSDRAVVTDASKLVADQAPDKQPAADTHPAVDASESLVVPL